MGRSVAKVTWDACKNRRQTSRQLVLVTSVNPTPFSEGKTVTTIGLTQALCRIGQSATCVIENHRWVVFGIKGELLVAVIWSCQWKISICTLPVTFTQLPLPHNLLSALIDNHIKHGNECDLDSTKISWPRVLDMNDRALRDVIGMGGTANGHLDKTDLTSLQQMK